MEDFPKHNYETFGFTLGKDWLSSVQGTPSTMKSAPSSLNYPETYQVSYRSYFFI